MAGTPGDITRLIARIHDGDEAAKDALFDQAYAELRSIAGGIMRGERADHTLQPTSLVNEAALRLLAGNEVQGLQGRAHFFWAMARAMRQILVEHVRKRKAQRRSGGHNRVGLDMTITAIEKKHGVDLLVLDEALSRLEQHSARQARVVTMRFFAGFTMQKIAEQLEVSLSTVEKDWTFAKAWLHRELLEPS
jgi:RNA polymerase sigma factor (TIGR02999 family)